MFSQVFRSALPSFFFACVVFSLQPTVAQTNSNWTEIDGGEWSDDANWSTASFPNNSGTNLFNATIDLATGSDYTVTLSDSVEIENLILDSSDALLHLTGAVQANQGMQIQSGRFWGDGVGISNTQIDLIGGGAWLYNGATVQNSVIDVTGGSLTFDFGFTSTVDNSTVNGMFSVNSSSSVLFTNGATFSGNPSLSGTLLVDGNDSGSNQRTFDASQTFLMFGGSLAGTSGTNLVFGSTSIVRGRGLVSSPNAIINEGLFHSNVRSHPFRVASVGGFTNRGTVRAENSSRFEFEEITRNESLMEAVEGSTLRFSGDWLNNGTIRLTDSSAAFLGEMEFDDLGSIEQSGDSSVLIGGNMDLGGSSETITNRTGDLTLGITGRISNGTLNQGDARLLFFEEIGTTTKGILDNVTLNDGLRITQNDAFLRLENGSKFNDASEVTGLNSTLQLGGSEGTQAAAVYRFDSDADLNVTATVDYTGNARFEIGADSTLMGSGTFEDNTEEANSELVNDGRVEGNLRINVDRFLNRNTVATSGSNQMLIGAEFINQGNLIASGDSDLYIQNRFTNTGTMTASDNGEVILESVSDDLGDIQTTENGKFLINQSWDLTGKTVVLDDASLNLQVRGAIIGGTIHHQNGGGLKFDPGLRTELEGTTMIGNVGVTGTNATLVFRDGAKIESGGSLSLAELSRVNFEENSDGSRAVHQLSNVAVTSLLNSRYALMGDVDLIIGPNSSLTGVGEFVSGIGEVNQIINRGAVTATGLGVLRITDNFFVNEGSLVVDSGSNLSFFDENPISNGTTRVNGRMSGLSSLDYIENGSLDGDGLIEISVILNGMITPGVDGIGELEMWHLDLNDTAEWIVDIGGTSAGEIDLLSITRSIELDGSLSANFVNDFNLAEGQSFIFGDISGTRTGQFAGLDEGDVVMSQSDVYLRVSYTAGDGDDLGFFTTAVPEPSAIWVLTSLGLCGLLNRRRR